MKEQYIEKFIEAIKMCDNIGDIDYAYKVLIQCINYDKRRSELIRSEAV